MLLLLPERTDGMRQMVRDLQQGSLLNVINNDLEESEYIVSIPKFSIEFDSDLVPALNKVKQAAAAAAASGPQGLSWRSECCAWRREN